jgi:hypothetical protein
MWAERRTERSRNSAIPAFENNPKSASKYKTRAEQYFADVIPETSQ